jgi:hypothetical protein
VNLFFGALAGFVGWSSLGFVASWLLLKLYDGNRFPMDKISEEDEKSNSSLRIKYALGSGIIVGIFWLEAIHNNPLISN